MIETVGLTKIFDGFTAVDHINLHVSSGQILALLGPNGAGKTTTVRMLSSILSPSEGQAKIAELDVTQFPSEVRKKVGVLTEHHGLYGRMNADEYLVFFGQLYGLTKPEILQRINPLLEQLDMTQYRKKRLGEYSKGMRQKLALVRALLHDPPVLLLDEPTSAMDPESALIVRNAIKSLRNKDRTIIICTHNLTEAEELCDQIAIIQNGKIILNKSMKEVRNSLIGGVVFIARFRSPIDESKFQFSGEYHVEKINEFEIKFIVNDPEKQNPALIRQLSQEFELVSFEEIPNRLEDTYLDAIYQQKGNTHD